MDTPEAILNETPELGSERLDAGERYYEALKKLGLRPDGLLWAYEWQNKRFVLVVVTAFFDYKGPFEISKLLFKAYNAAGTPRDIDPFIVRLHSPNQSIARVVLPMVGTKEVISKDTGKRTGVKSMLGHDLVLSKDWVYRLQIPKPSQRASLPRRWARFSENVGRLAA